MINLHPLYSSSSGNTFHIETPKSNILIDVGVSYKAITTGLASINKEISDISAVIITHEHSDHIAGISQLCKKNNIPIFACGKTANYLQNLLNEKNIKNDIYEINYGKPFKIDDVEITSFETSHDAIMPCGYRIKNENSILTYSTDLGYVSDEVFENLQNSDYIILEANYDESMLDFGKYPYYLKRRIKGKLGHLSNVDCANTNVKLKNQDSKAKFILAHMSENNNNLALAKSTIDSILLENNIDLNGIEINFASKKLSNEVYTIC